jgi:two-component system, sensor histidine kinase YesM
MSPFASIVKLVLIVTAVALLLTLTVTYFMARQLTVPIKKIHSQIKKFDLNYIPSKKQQILNSNIDELEELNDAFQNMHLKLKQSVMDMLEIQKRELQSKLFALQSQMNPHFLHNTLANICMMAEENMNEEIVKMCKNISHMLRYISTDKSSSVELKRELEYTVQYLECMKTRYNGSLVYKIDIPEEMLEIQIPKLVIQPFVENSIKYGIHVEPPWVIDISGYRRDKQWIVNIKDNGPGFAEEKILEIRQRLENVKSTQPLSGMELDGMGIINIYARLKILYREMAVFEINNLSEGGAFITIGGGTRDTLTD